MTPQLQTSTSVGATATCLEEVSVCHDVTQSKVGNLDIVLVVQKEVLGFEISVYNFVAMAVLDCTDDLLEEFAGLVLLQPSVVDNVVEQFTASIFEDHDDFSRRCYDRVAGEVSNMKQYTWVGNVQLDDVGVSQQLQILDLAFDSAGHISGNQSLAVDDLEGDLLAADLMCSQFDFTKGALAQSLGNGILSQSLARLGVAGLVCFNRGRR
jgi:hypothetical protein